MSSTAPRKEFKFFVNPRESLEERELRWDRWMSELASEGFTIRGVGPDGDYPIRYSFGDYDVPFDEWWTGNPDAPWFEVYTKVPLPSWCQTVEGPRRYHDMTPGEPCEHCGFLPMPVLQMEMAHA